MPGYTFSDILRNNYNLVRVIVTVSFVLNLVNVPEYDPMLKITHFKLLPEKNLTVTSYTGCLDWVDMT